jgi:hypothetical protein
VPDAIDPCPACGAVQWQHAGDRVRCGSCDYRVSWNLHAGVGPSDREPVDPDEAAESEAWTAVTARRLALEELAAFRFYAVAEVAHHPRLAGHGTSGGRMHSVSLAHGEDLIISTERIDEHSGLDDFPASALRNAHGLRPGPWPERSRWALSVWLEVSGLAQEAAIDAATAFAHHVEVDGRPVGFAGLRDGPVWSLTAPLGDVRVAIGGVDREPYPRRLRRVLDPVGELG